MAINYARLKSWRFEEVEHRYGAKDAMLYALGVGLGADPLDRRQLRFVYEGSGLQALPMMATVLATPGFWVRDPATGIDWRQALHAEQGLVLHQPLPPAATVLGRTVIEGIVDQGPGRGALVHLRREITEKETGAALCTLSATTFCRGAGGFGGPAGRARPAAMPLPDRPAEILCDMPTLAQAALLYRLNGDDNPLHADSAVAREAGFARPILHGLCTFGIAGHAILRAVCGYDARRLKRLDMRFSAPVFPGETIRTEIWRETGRRAVFRCRVLERDAVVITNGLAETAP
jgi:acyl dehydratase